MGESRDRGQEAGLTAEHSVRQGKPPVQPGVPESVDRLRRIAAQGDDAQCGVLDQSQRETVRPESGEPARSGERRGDVVDGHRT